MSRTPADGPLYRVVGHGFEVEAFDDRVVVLLHVGRSRELSASTFTEELMMLCALRDKGALSEDEFTLAKRRLIGER